jgi:ABC-type transporter Mla subunit MlaD
VLAGAAGVAAIVAAAFLGISAGSSEGSYTVRAIFDDAANIISGEDVKIAGVKVGTVGSVTPTPGAKAAVELKISKEGFKDFRQDASCTIRPQALIGEKYVDCLPTQPRVEGTPLPPPLRKVSQGEGEGEYLLPVSNTHSPVDVDLLGDINRLPERQRFTIILNELGAGLAGRGSDLKAVIQRANPALQELDKVLNILASENTVLAQLAVNSDQALKPWAQQRENFADFIVQANKVAQASAAHSGALAKNVQLFPPFLRQLGPAMERLGRFADQTTPVARELKQAAPGINETFTSIPAFSASSIKFFKNLGQTSKVSGPALTATEPLLTRLQALGNAGKPFATSLAELLSSLRDTGGLERIMDFIFMGTGAANGYDSLGHFFRAEGVGTACLPYATGPNSTCNRKLFNTRGGEVAPASKASLSSIKIDPRTTSAVMARTLAVLKGSTPAEALAKYPESAPAASQPQQAAGGGAAPTAAQPVGGSTGGTTYYAPSAESSSAGGMLLNYLLGN